MAKATSKTKKKTKKAISSGKAYINCTFNNTIITFTDPQGNVVGWSSSGANGFRGAKKSTPFAAQQVVETAYNNIKDVGLREVDVIVKGPGMGREAAIRTLASMGLKIKSIIDETPIPHNGCRPRKKRRM
ncbi:MAG: 30S ribosomal protein S11 [Spirochaetes bacterium]|nr:30S ribosomal protein S11 [Spirochaetota bacterium]